MGRLSIGHFIVRLICVFGGLCRGVGFHLADYDVLTGEWKEQQLDVEAVAVAMFPGRADFLPKAPVGVRLLGDRVKFVRRLVVGSGSHDRKLLYLN